MDCFVKPTDNLRLTVPIASLSQSRYKDIVTSVVSPISLLIDNTKSSLLAWISLISNLYQPEANLERLYVSLQSSNSAFLQSSGSVGGVDVTVSVVNVILPVDNTHTYAVSIPDTLFEYLDHLSKITLLESSTSSWRGWFRTTVVSTTGSTLQLDDTETVTSDTSASTLTFKLYCNLSRAFVATLNHCSWPATKCMVWGTFGSSSNIAFRHASFNSPPSISRYAYSSIISSPNKYLSAAYGTVSVVRPSGAVALMVVRYISDIAEPSGLHPS